MTDTCSEGIHRRDPVAVNEAILAFYDLVPDGFMMFAPIRDDRGEISDFEWTFVNRAAGEIVGRAPDDLIGKRLLVEMPANRDEGLFDAYVAVVETGEVWQLEFHYDEGNINAWFRATATKSGDGLAVSFADISEVRKGQERLQGLIDGLLTFVGVLSLDGTLLEANETAVAAAGVSRDELINVPFWDCYWWGINTETQDRLKKAVATAATGENVRYDAEIQIVGDRRMWIDFQIAPVVNAAGEVVELIPSGIDITERKQAETHRELLINELSHRVKNTLSTIQSIAGQTIRSANSMEDFRGAFSARLQAISASHDLLVEFDHMEVPLVALLRGQIQPYVADKKHLSLEGDDIVLPGESAHLLSLVLHELAANASKYGALSVEAGEVRVTWQVETEDKTRKLFLTWIERNGPLVKTPVRRGFGTRLIERSVASGDDGVVLTYDPEGFSCKLEMMLA